MHAAPPKSVCVFCGSNRGARKDYSLAAEELGAELARRGLKHRLGAIDGHEPQGVSIALEVGRIGLDGERDGAPIGREAQFGRDAEGGEVLGGGLERVAERAELGAQREDVRLQLDLGLDLSSSTS